MRHLRRTVAIEQGLAEPLRTSNSWLASTAPTDLPEGLSGTTSRRSSETIFFSNQSSSSQSHTIIRDDLPELRRVGTAESAIRVQDQCYPLVADPSGAQSTEQDEWRWVCPDSELLSTRLEEHFGKILVFVREQARGLSFYEIEQILISLVFTLGRLCLALCLCYRHEELRPPQAETRQGRTFKRRDPQARLLGTFFGKVRYWRTYMYARGGGYYPLDEQLNMPADGFSFHLCSLIARLATKMSYLQATLVLRCFLGWSPSHTTVEHTVFGLGRHTQAFFEQAPMPKDDGEVMVIMIDSKATPTATEEELKKRRGPRKPTPVPGSPRHRGRAQRKRRGPRKRRKKADKSKNGKMATLVVMYTLRPARARDDGQPVLLGPINKRLYAFLCPQAPCLCRGSP